MSGEPAKEARVTFHEGDERHWFATQRVWPLEAAVHPSWAIASTPLQVGMPPGAYGGRQFEPRRSAGWCAGGLSGFRLDGRPDRSGPVRF